MPKKLTKKQIGEIQLTSGWTQDELNDPGVLAIRKQLEDQQRQIQESPRPSFDNVVGSASTVPAQAESSGIMDLLNGLDSFVTNERNIDSNALVGGIKRSAGAALFSLADNPLASFVENTLRNAKGGIGGQFAQAFGRPEDQVNPSMEVGGDLFQRGSKQVADAYTESQKHTTGVGRQLSGGIVDVLASPSSALSILGGPVGLLGAGGDTAAQEYTAGRLAGLSREDAGKRAGVQGGIEGLISALPTGHAFEAMVPSGVRRELMGTIPKIVANVGATAGAEAAEETATTAAQLLADKVLAQSDNKELADYANSNLPKNAAGVAEALWRSARAGALSGGAIRTPGALFEAALDNANHAAQIIATGEQAVSERNARKPAPKVDIPKPTATIPTQGELFGGESSPLPQAPEVPSTTKPMLPAGPDLFPKETAKFLAGRAEAAKLIDKETKNIQSTAKSARASARRSFMTKLLADTRDLPKADRVERIASATERWDASNPIESFLEKAAAPKAKKGKKTKAVTEKPAAVSPADLLNRFDGLAQNSLDNPDSTPPENSGAIEHVFRTMVKKVGKGDTKVLNKMMQDGNLKVVEDPSFIPTKKPLDAATKGYYDGNTTYIVAKNLDRKNIVGDMLSIAAHETKHAADVSGNETLKANLKGLIGDEANDRLVSKIEGLARKDKIVAKLVEIVKDDHPNDNTYKLELPAYFMNYALDKRNKTFLVKRVMDDAASAVITGAKRKLGIADVSLEDVAYLARSLVKEAAVSGERLTGDVASKIKGDPTQGLKMIEGKRSTFYDTAKKAGLVYKSVDGNEKFLVSDKDAKLVNSSSTMNDLFDGKAVELNKIVDHPLLFDAYPQLAKTKVRVSEKLPKGAGAYWDRANDSIVLSTSEADMLTIDPNRALDTILHETQHAVQDIEGFSRGANPDMFINVDPDVSAKYKSATTRMKDANAQLGFLVKALNPESVSRYTDGNKSVAAQIANSYSQLRSNNITPLEYLEDVSSSMEESGDLTPNGQRLVDRMRSKVQEYIAAKDEVGSIWNAADTKYFETLGELEARFTEDKRKKSQQELPINPEDPAIQETGKGLDVPAADSILVTDAGVSGRANGNPATVDDSFEERQAKKREEEAVARMRKAGEVLKTQKDAEEDTAANDDTPEGLAFIPRKYTIGNERVKDVLRVAERLLWSGGFVSSTLKEITLHASHLPASLMVKATKYGNDMLSAIDRNAAEAGKGRSADDQRKIRQRLRVDLGKEIERIDALPTRAERDAALDALDRNPRFAGIGQAVRAIRNYKMELTREIIALRSRDPKPLTEKETAIYNKMIENAERYTTRAYLATYNDKIGVKYGKNLWKRFQRDPDSLEGKIVQNALDFLKDHELVIPEEETLHSMGTMQIRRMYENWVGSSTSFKGDKGRRQMIRALANLPEHTQEEIDAKATEIVKDLLNLNKNKGVSARFYSIGSKQNRTILESRTDMPAELRALMGEITDPFLREAISLQRMINLSAKTKLLTEVFEKGADKGWWSGIKTDGHETQLNDIAYGPMNGKWINSDLEDALTGTILSLESTDKMIADSIHNPTAFSQYLAGKSVKLLTGMSRVQKTYRIVFNLAQMGFNAGGAFLNVGLNGIVNPATAYRGARDALLTLSSEINTKIVNEKNLPTIQEIIRAGVIDSATVGEFKSQAYQNITEQIQKLDPDQPGYAQQVMHIMWDFVSAQGSIPNAIRQVYAYMDVWTKVATYYDRKNFLTEYNKLEGKKWTEEQIQRRAGYEASGTNISYERAIPLAKIIEKNLPFGMFLTYFSEVPRTIGTSMIQAGIDAKMAMDAKNPKAKALARNKAVARFLGTGAVTAGVIAGTVNALGTDDEEEKKRRRLDPNWMQNKYTLPVGLDAEGHEVLFEVNRFDPNGPFNEAMVAVITAPEDKKAQAVYNQVLGLFVPAQGAIAGYRVLHDMLVEAAARATGNSSLYDADMASKRTVMERNYPKQFAKLKHMLSYGDFGENMVSMIEQLWLPASVQPLVDQKGRVITVRPQDKDVGNVPQELGYRPYVRNPDESFDFRIRDYDNAVKAIMKDRGKLLRDADRLDEATLVKELNDMVAREKEAFDTLRYNYEGYMAYQGKTLKDANEHFDSKKLFQQIRYNKFRPRTISPDSLRNWAKQQIKEGRDREEVMAVYNLLKKAYTESGTDTED